MRAGDVLFAAGMPDVIDPRKRTEGVLVAISAEDGAVLTRYKLAAPTVWDGLAVAGGKLYAALANGEIAAFKQQ